MKILKVGFWLLLGIFLIGYLFFPSITVRYRMTVNAEVDGQLKAGSSIIDLTYAKSPGFLGAPTRTENWARGEAAAIDMDQNGLLLVLLAEGKNIQSAPNYIVPIAFNLTEGGLGYERMRQLHSLKGKRALLPSELWPLIVVFKDLKDPLSMKPVESVPSVLIKDVAIEIIDTAEWPRSMIWMAGTRTTAELEKRMPWLNDPRSARTLVKKLAVSGHQVTSTDISSAFVRK